MTIQQLQPIAILGAGSWGTALALYLARRGQQVRLWSVEPAEITAMRTDRANQQFLPGHLFPETITPFDDLQEAVTGVKDVLIVVPSIGFRETLVRLQETQTKPRIVCATKGLDPQTGELLSDTVEKIFGYEHPLAILSGPSFAKEVASGLPSAVILATKNSTFSDDLYTRFHSSLFQIERSTDVRGVEVGGIVKNVIAIATGFSDGLAFGTNARSAIITRGLAEMIHLGLALGGDTHTFLGLSGLGDLILTCSDNQSRNRRLGLAIGAGKSVQEAEHDIGQVVEGKRNAELVNALALKHQVHMPICRDVWKILQGENHIKEKVLSWMSVT